MVKVTDAIFRIALAIFHALILKPLYKYVFYDSILNKVTFQHCRSKVKVKATILEKTLSSF